MSFASPSRHSGFRKTPIAWLLAQIYWTLSEVKNVLYQAGFLDSVKLQKPVVSIGNLTVGGTGKTPFTQMIIQRLTSRGIKVAVVGRNYRGQTKGTVRVDPALEQAAFLFGDEPALLAQKNPDVPVFVGPEKWSTAIQAFNTTDAECIIVDDGFQHRALHRNLDFVLLDATSELKDYKPLPWGLARESIKNLRRADFVVLSKVNMVPEETLQQLKALLPSDLPVIEMSYRLESPVEEAGFKVLAISGIAKPESFVLSLKQDTLYEVVGLLGFPDHHPFELRDLEKIYQAKVNSGAQVVVMTEKDFVKIQPLMRTHAAEQITALRPEDVRVLPLKTHFLDSSANFDAALDRLFSRA
jgi:tetraacyldisaccharide 4'-kinase